MNKAEGIQKGDQRSVSPGRHKRNCTVCAHDKCEEIEREFVNWTAATVIARDYGLADKASVYRHAHAFGLFAKRQRNIRAALEKIIERAGDVEVTSSAVVAAVQAYAKINAQRPMGRPQRAHRPQRALRANDAGRTRNVRP